MDDLSGYTAGRPHLNHATEIVDTVEAIIFVPTDSSPGSPFLRDFIDVKRYMALVVE